MFGLLKNISTIRAKWAFRQYLNNDSSSAWTAWTWTYLTQCAGEAERADALEVPDQVDTLAPVTAREVGALVDVGAAVTT